MSDKTKLNTWTKVAIDNKYFKLYEYEDFSNIQEIGSEKVFVQI